MQAEGAGCVLGGTMKQGVLAARSRPIVDEQKDLLTALLAGALGLRLASQTSERLIERYGSLLDMFAASPEQLSRVPGVGPATLRIIATAKSVSESVARERLPSDKPLLASWDDLLEYLHVVTAAAQVEQFRVLFLDKRHRLIVDEVQQVGTIDHISVYPREVIKRSLELSATALILVHNHPSGDPAPSSADVRLTRQIADIAKSLGIVLHDHLIVGKSGHASLKALKLF
jgi:DNA repair protein RadC